MKSDTKLDYAIFQLTPTRTRCELHVASQGVTYKLASGLLAPFVAHLRVAEEQVAKGGYSIKLEPPDPGNAAWFTKGAMERFVRFVSTPEVLERVSTIEAELLQLEGTLHLQDNDIINGVDNSSVKHGGMPFSTEGKPSASSTTVDKPTLPLIKTTRKEPMDAADAGAEEGSKQWLLRALDARRLVLQKEQGMAFARAIAAGFSIENLNDLVVFSDCFGATRLREASIKFLELCQKRQDDGLWLEDLDLAAAEAEKLNMVCMDESGETGLRYMNNGDYTCSNNRLQEQQPLGIVALQGFMGDGEHREAGLARQFSDSLSWQQGQLQNPYVQNVFPPSLHGGIQPSPPAGPQNLAGHVAYSHFMSSNPYMQPHYPPIPPPLPPAFWPASRDHGNLEQQLQPERSMHNSNHQEHGLHAVNGTKPTALRPSTYEATETSIEMDVDPNAESTRRLPRRSSSPSRRSSSPLRKVQIGRAGQKRSGMVVIRNINYIAPNTPNTPSKEDDGSESSGSWSEEGVADDEGLVQTKAESGRIRVQDVIGLFENKKHDTADTNKKKSTKEAKNPSSKNAVLKRWIDSDGLNESIRDEHEEDSGPKNVVKSHNHVKTLIINRGESDGPSQDAEAKAAHSSQSTGIGLQGGQSEEGDLFLVHNKLSSRSSHLQSTVMFTKEELQEGNKKLPITDDSFMLLDKSRSHNAEAIGSVDPDFEQDKCTQGFQTDKRSADDSFIMLDRSGCRERADNSNAPLDMESELVCDLNLNDNSGKSGNRQASFEPDDLFMVPERSKDASSSAHGASVNYDMEVLAADMIIESEHSREQEGQSAAKAPCDGELQEHEGIKSIRTAKEPKSKRVNGKEAKAMQEALEKRQGAASKRSGKVNPLVEAQLRAEKLREYKAGLQARKKEKEEEERKRIENLKNQRRERIAARSSPKGTAQSPTSSRNVRAAPLTVNNKSSPSATAINKLASPVKSSSVSPNVTRTNHHSAALRSGHNKLTSSVPSLRELHKESSKTTPSVRASTGSQIKNSETPTDSSPLNKNKSRTEEKKKVPSTGVLRKGIPPAKENKMQSSPAAKPSKVPTAVGKQQKKAAKPPAVNDSIPLASQEEKSDIPVVDQASHAVLQENDLISRASPAENVSICDCDDQQPSEVGESNGPFPSEVGETGVTESYGQIRAPVSTEAEASDKVTDDGICITDKENIETVALNEVLEERNEDGCSVDSPVHGLTSDSPMELGPDSTAVYCAPIANATSSTEDTLTTYVEPAAMSGEESHLLVEPSTSPPPTIPEEYIPPFAPLSDSPVGLQSQTVVDQYNPPFAPLTESPTVTPPKNLCLLEAIQQAHSPERSPPSTGTATRSRKKWSESQKTPKDHAKGLKRLLLLRKKSSHTSPQSQDWVVTSEDEGDDTRDSPSSNGKAFVIAPVLNDQASPSPIPAQCHGSSGNSGSKASRSFFSLSTFRGKGEAKA